MLHQWRVSGGSSRVRLTVQASTVIPPARRRVVRVRHEDFGIAVKTDCNSRYVRLDPYEGGKATVAEAARNVACTGARPLGITDCLNFGSPSAPRSSISSAKRVAASPMPAGHLERR